LAAFELRRGPATIAIRPSPNGYTGLINGVPIANGNRPAEALRAVLATFGVRRSAQYGRIAHAPTPAQKARDGTRDQGGENLRRGTGPGREAGSEGQERPRQAPDEEVYQGARAEAREAGDLKFKSPCR
jgi:hypothetical protein